MTRKQKRDQLRAYRRDMSNEGRQVAIIRRSTFGSLAPALTLYFASKVSA